MDKKVYIELVAVVLADVYFLYNNDIVYTIGGTVAVVLLIFISWKLRERKNKKAGLRENKI